MPDESTTVALLGSEALLHQIIECICSLNRTRFFLIVIQRTWFDPGHIPHSDYCNQNSLSEVLLAGIRSRRRASFLQP